MGLTKTSMHKESTIELANFAKALGHPARIAILKEILKTNNCICMDLSETIGLSQPTISQHLQQLKRAKIIKGNITGNKVCYCIDEVTISRLKEYLLPFLHALSSCETCNTNSAFG